MTAVVSCPTCRRPVEWTASSLHRPFCSERCRMVDLGAWLTEQHKIPDEAPEPFEAGSESGEE